MNPEVTVVIRAINRVNDIVRRLKFPVINKYISPVQKVRQVEQEKGFGILALILSHFDSECSSSPIIPDTSIIPVIIN